MSQDDITRMAREAGLYHFYDSEGDLTGITDARPIDEDKQRNDDRLVEILEPFARLVYEATFRDANIAASKTILDAAVLEEREACAKVCFREAAFVPDPIDRERIYQCAAIIRARSKK